MRELRIFVPALATLPLILANGCGADTPSEPVPDTLARAAPDDAAVTVRQLAEERLHDGWDVAYEVICRAPGQLTVSTVPSFATGGTTVADDGERRIGIRLSIRRLRAEQILDWVVAPLFGDAHAAAIRATGDSDAVEGVVWVDYSFDFGDRTNLGSDCFVIPPGARTVEWSCADGLELREAQSILLAEWNFLPATLSGMVLPGGGRFDRETNEVVDEADLEKRMLALRLLLDWKPR